MAKIKRNKTMLVYMAVCSFAMALIINTAINSWPEIFANKSQVEILNQKYNELLANEEKLESQVTKLQDPDYIARYAKEKYMYSSEGETIIRMDD